VRKPEEMKKIQVVLVILFLSSARCRDGSNPDRGYGLLLLSSPEISSDLGISGNLRVPSPCTTQNPISDPLVRYQWHLENTGEVLFPTNLAAGVAGEDIRIRPVWNLGNFGQSVLVSVVDDGLDLDHEDLIDNTTSGSRNFLANNGYPPDHPGGILASHGTSVAGIIAARGDNGIGLTGVAPCAHLIGFNFLVQPTTVNLNRSLISAASIVNNSWGSEDGTGLLHYPVSIWADTIWEGVTNSRKGLGTVYVWSSGNGHFGSEALQNLVDNANYDGYLNHPGIIVVGAATNQGKRASYSERGSNLWISSYSGDQGRPAITTTDLRGEDWGYNPGGVSPNTLPTVQNYPDRSYTNSFNGTSAASPSVSGVVALVLKERPDLSYRDVKLILAKASRKLDPSDPNWRQNSAGIWFNPSYGFGVVDAENSLLLARSWSSVGGQPQQKLHTTPVYGNVSLPPSSVLVVQIPIAGSGIDRIEYVELTLDLSHSDPGKLEIELESPSSPHRARVYERHICYSEKNRSGGIQLCNPIQGFSFGVSQFLDEPTDGIWKIYLSNSHSSPGHLNSARIRIYGR